MINTSGNWGRQIVRGILAFAQEVGPWHILVHPTGADTYRELPARWRGDGIIAHVASPKIANQVRATGLPVVNVADSKVPGFAAPCFRTDDAVGARMAADHFIQRGIRNFGFVGPVSRVNPAWYAQKFREILQSEGHAAEIYPMQKDETDLSGDLIAWLKALPKPAGVFVWGHGYALRVMDCCMTAEIPVPHDVAVLSGSYDDLLSHACFPSLSGLIAPTEQIGYQAAQALHRMMQGKTVPVETTYIPPRGVMERPSTDTLAVEDERLVKVVEYLRTHALGPITVDDILRHVPMARRSLERRFRHSFGCTPADEIRRIRINHARMLLSETHLPMQEIAEACGYATYNYLTAVFKQSTGMTPRDFRKQFRH